MMSKRNHPSFLLSSQAGFTLIELIIVMGIFIIAIILSSDAFNRIASLSAQQVKSSESNIQGIIGLEIMRSDIEHAGYGLPWEMPFVADFEESQKNLDDLAKGINPKTFNDKGNTTSDDSNKVPRAVQSATAQSATADPATDGRDYLVIKSTAIGMTDVVKKWTYVEGVATGAYSLKTWGVNDFAENNRVTVLNSSTRRLVTTAAATFLAATANDTGYTFSDKLTSTPNLSKVDFVPQDDTELYLVYGISETSDLRVPYNRADYYIARPDDENKMPKRCASGTGILYKAVLNHADGNVKEYPLLDCIADMQVVYGVDPDGIGPEVATPLQEDALQDLSAKQIREQLKLITVYVLTHEGQKDRTYTYQNQKIIVGESASAGREFDLATLKDIGSDWKYYRWKVYRFTVTPRNLNY